MKYLGNIFSKSPEYKRIKAAISSRDLPAAVNGVSHIHKALILAANSVESKRKALFLSADEGECARLLEDLSAMKVNAVMFPARDFTLRDVSVYSREYEHKRVAALERIIKGDYDVLLASIDAAVQYTLPKSLLEHSSFTIKVGSEQDSVALISRLIGCGYTRSDIVEGVGQFSIRGGIVDVFPPNCHAPIRVDLWGDEVDKLSFIDIKSQRSTEEIDEVLICPAVEVFCANRDDFISSLETQKATAKRITENAKVKLQNDIDVLRGGGSVPLDRYLPLVFKENYTLFDYMDDAILYVSESLKVSERLRAYFWQLNEDQKQLLEEGLLIPQNCDLGIEPAELNLRFEKMGAIYLESFARSSYDTKIKSLFSFNLQQSSFWSGAIDSLADDILSAPKGINFLILAGTERAATVLCSDLSSKGIKADFRKELDDIKGVTVAAGGLSAGFYIPSINLTVITQGKNNQAKKKAVKRPKNAAPYGSLDELQKGDYVVHTAHGIGVFDGIVSMSVSGVKKDYIKILYAGQSVLYVPVTQLDLVSKYIGPREDSGVRLHKLGGSEWTKTRTRVKKAVKDMAKQLTVLYAKRMQQKGYPFSEDSDLQSDFECRFEYEETEDQLRCTDEIKSDMQRAVPMDRLLCGDVGFGKTEVALRAAFKCVADGKQCAILVPTTILAWQHYNTTLNRLGNLPVNVEMLSRFRTKKQQTDILRRLKSGELDIIIGTHRLISKDVEFHDLGLVIVDEEQRFGVEQKEKLKELFPQVDVLTLSATPIPRTLNMAMTGLRDMSVIEEAPGDRHPVQTYVLEQDDGVLSEAINRELRRGGQVYYLHNKVESIEAAALRLKMRFPDAIVETAHGKMDEATLSRVWKRLLEHEIDILVCTTIIETGVDVPNANTLIIEDADRMGLSQLHQLRGRVGRSARRAYAYLCFRRGKAISDIATKRLTAIREFTEFGSGFKIAMRDLEIRGAGSILGGEQHGHMEAVGYDMYLKLLSEAVDEEKGIAPPPKTDECLVDLSIPAHIPDKYISSTPQRLGVYRRIASIRTEAEREDVIDELIDRFGEPPKTVLALCDISLLRMRAASLGIKEVSEREGSILIYVASVNSEAVAKACSGLRGRAMLNASSKPYVAVRKDKDKSILENLNDILDVMEK